MNEPQRPDPDALLASIQRDERLTSRGRLRIFIGMAPGVGKTYAMLQAAQALKANDVDVVVGLVETHGRQETEALVEGLTIVPRTVVNYRGVELRELDLDAILRRKPAYVLVDELAHTNAEGLRHRKRHQDVVELLDNGINVYTTLNVQHIESQVDTVREIAGVAVRETVPDSVIDAAAEVELVDLSPDELIRRLAEGKVYTSERSAEAINRFFQKGTLTALRELALRRTAERVDLQLKDYMQANRIPGPWKTADRLMVAVGPSPHSEQLVRATRRLASVMEAPWLAVYVQTPQALSDESEKRLKKNIALAQELGAELVTTTDDDIVRALVRTAREHNVTQIVVGKSTASPVADLLRGGALVDRLVRASGAIDVYIVQGSVGRSDVKPLAAGEPPVPRSTLRQYAIALGGVLAAALLCEVFGAFIDYRSVGVVLLFVTTALSLLVGRGPVFFAAILAAVVWDFLFIPPRYTFFISQTLDILLLLLFFLVAVVTGTLTSRARMQRANLRRRERQTAALYSLVNDLSSADSIDDIATSAVERLSAEFDARVALYLADTGGELPRKPRSPSTFTLKNDKEWSVVEWVFRNRRPAGRDTDTLPFAAGAYYPLLSHESCVGVVGIAAASGRALPTERATLFQMHLHQIALALERLHLRSEHLNKTLLRSISHELRTPLSVIASAASGLSDTRASADPEIRGTLVGDIRSAAARLDRLVENLLDMTRIESGALSMRREWCDVGDLFNAVLNELRDELAGRRVVMDLQRDLPLVELDSVLIEQAIANVVLNAAQYSPDDSIITLSASYEAGWLALTVDDEGPGLPADAPNRVFEKFYRIPGTKPGGTGLGLSIVKGFVEFHGGTVRASNRVGQGARFTIRLPVPHKPIAPEAGA